MAIGQYLGAGNGTTKGLWHLNGDATDSSGNGNNGTATNVTWVGGRIGGGSASFNGSSSKIRIPNSSSINIGGTGSNVTLSAWVNMANANLEQNVVCKGLDNLNSMNWQLRVDSGTKGNKVVFRMAISGSGRSHKTPVNSLSVSAWYHVVCTCSYGASVPVIYINGVAQTLSLDDNTLSVYNMPSTSLDATIGIENDGRLPYSGLIDEVIVENRIWSATEVKKYYTYSKGRFGIN